MNERQEATIEVHNTGYSFWREWVLVLPTTERHGTQRFYLGQDVKFCTRVLGMDTGTLAHLTRQEMGVKNNKPVNLAKHTHARALARVIIRLFGGMRAIRNHEAWELAGN